MCAENNQNQEKELEQIIASSANYRTEEEAIALAVLMIYVTITDLKSGYNR